MPTSTVTDVSALSALTAPRRSASRSQPLSERDSLRQNYRPRRALPLPTWARSIWSWL